LMALLSWGNPLHLPLLLVGWAGALGWVLTLRATHVTAQDDRAQGGEQVPEEDIAPLRQRVMWVAASAIPMLAILVLGRDAQSRHFAAAMPPLLVLAGIGWAWVVERLGRWNWARHVTASSSQTTPASSLHRSWAPLQALALLIPFAAFAWNAYHDPAATNMPPLMAWQYVEGYASGYGLREAVEAFPDTLQERDLTIVGSMYGDSCRRANFYARDARTMLCGDTPMRDAIEEALMRDGAVYVLVERGGEIGINLTTLDARARLIAAYPRPHESADDASVRLWRLER
jgi:hypothetical protein